MFNSILIICTANICRSPMAEALFKKHLPDKMIASAGTRVAELSFDDCPADNSALLVTHNHGLTLSEHKARQVNSDMLKSFELILVMNHSQLEEVSKLTAGVRSKTLLVGQWINQGDIVDPYRKEVASFERCFKILEQATLSWARKCYRNSAGKIPSGCSEAL